MKHFSAFICNLSQFISPSTFHYGGSRRRQRIFLCVRRNLLRRVISLSNCRVHCQGGCGRGRGPCTSRSRCDYRPAAKKVVRSHRLGSFGRCAVITAVPEKFSLTGEPTVRFSALFSSTRMKEGENKGDRFLRHRIGLDTRHLTRFV